MADTTIEWTDKTWNPTRGCARKSPGCKNCYAERVAMRFSGPGQPYEGLVKMTSQGPKWTGIVREVPEMLDAPLQWKKPRRIFVDSMSDLFEETVSEQFIDQVFAVMAVAHHHTFQVLTKRPERAREYLSDRMRLEKIYQMFHSVTGGPREAQGWPLPNVWLGVSVESQEYADERIPLLLQTPAAVRFISAEPLLGPIDLRLVAVPPASDQLRRSWDTDGSKFNALQTHDERRFHQPPAKLDWVITGGESGPGARPMHPDWARSLRDQCAGAGVPFLFKQWGNWLPVYDRDKDDPDWRRPGRIERASPNGRWLNLAGGHGFNGDRVVWVDNLGKKEAGRLLDGRTWDGFPS